MWVDFDQPSKHPCTAKLGRCSWRQKNCIWCTCKTQSWANYAFLTTAHVIDAVRSSYACSSAEATWVLAVQVFTYGGQVNWMRYITGMRHRSQFKYAAGVTSAFMTVLYVIMGSVGYYRLGSTFDFSRPVTSILPHDAWNIVMNAGVFVHCIFAYQINLNVWADMVLHIVAPHMNESSARRTTTGRLMWAGVIIIGIAFSVVVSIFFPFFSIVMALIASIGDLAAAYALPAMFNLKLLGDRMPSWEKLVCYIIIPVSFVLSGLGVYSSLASLIHEFWQQH